MDYPHVNAELYDDATPDWPGEIDFYQRYAAHAHARDEAVLEIACGTGRITLPLAQQGIRITGLDRSPEMLQIARQKSKGLPHVRWVEGDMRTFDLGEQFGLVIFPGHPFQYMLTPDDQVETIRVVYNSFHIWMRIKGFNEGIKKKAGVISFIYGLRLPVTSKGLKNLFFVLLGVIVSGLAYFFTPDLFIEKFGGLRFLLIVPVLLMAYLIHKRVHLILQIYVIATLIIAGFLIFG